MKIRRLHGLLLYEYVGFVIESKSWCMSVSLIRPQWWQFRVNRYKRLREYFCGPVAFIFWNSSFSAD